MTGYGDRLLQAARGELEDGTGTVEVGPPPSGPCDAVLFLPGRTVVAADVDEEWVTALVRTADDVAPEARSVGLGRVVTALVERLGGPAATLGVLTAATPLSAMLRGEFTRSGAPDAAWAAYRRDVRTRRFTDHGLTGAIDVGRGPGGRWDTTVRVDRDGDARRLLAASLTLVPRDGVLFGSAPVHDARALVTMLGGGFRPVGLELLLLTRPGAAPADRSAAGSDTARRRPGRLARLFGAGGGRAS